MGRTCLPTVAAATMATLFIASTASAGNASTDEVTEPLPIEGTPGQYIVVMKSDPLASYTGGVDGIEATKTVEGERLEAQSQDAQLYVEHLEAAHTDLAAQVGVTPDTTYSGCAQRLQRAAHR